MKEGSKDLKKTLEDIEKILNEKKAAIDEVIETQTKEAAHTVQEVGLT